MTIVLLFAGIFALKTAVILFDKEDLIQKSKAFSEFTTGGFEFSEAF